MAHKVIYSHDGKEPTQIMMDKGLCDAIDFRFEDMPKSTMEERNFITLLLRDQISPPAFYGQFPNSNRYAYYNGNYLTIKLSKPQQGIELPQKDRLGHSWFDYAALYNGNEVIKQPLRGRNTDN